MRASAVGRVVGEAPPADVAALRRMKAVATAFLALAAAAYVAGVVVDGGRGGVLAFVRAGAEAGVVGGLADWFAVTALFRRPLGLPVPHSALIPRKKDELATKLGEFVTGWFLTPEALAAQVADAGVVRRVGEWLADPGHAAALAGELAVAADAALARVDGGEVADLVLDLARRHRASARTAPLVGRLLAAAVDGQAQRPLLDVLAARARDHLDTHVDELRPTVRRFIEERNWVTWLVTTDRFVTRLLRDAATELDDIARNPEHPLRAALEQVLRDVAADLQAEGAVSEGVEEVVGRLLDDDRVRAVARDAATGLIGSTRASLRGGGGPLVERAAALIARFGADLAGAGRLHDDAERWATDVVGHVVGRYGSELTTLIRRQVAEWPAAAASRRIELAVGRDLQFIRVNGTVVGALAGVAIHAVSLALPGAAL
ncbi:MAG TPA: DUF445 domain-containing protein [Acidimicrobiales bacterium]|nr:DUF445 domain-containing protein [Acidimicrobiales bacterium]